MKRIDQSSDKWTAVTGGCDGIVDESNIWKEAGVVKDFISSQTNDYENITITPWRDYINVPDPPKPTTSVSIDFTWYDNGDTKTVDCEKIYWENTRWRIGSQSNEICLFRKVYKTWLPVPSKTILIALCWDGRATTNSFKIPLHVLRKFKNLIRLTRFL
jgi:hypothetical protein